MISDIIIEKLHGLYNYNLCFKKLGKVSIITGPNGYGKTTILKIINHILYCKFWFFFFLDFKSVKLNFSNGWSLIVEKVSSSESDAEESSDIVSVKEKIHVRLQFTGNDNPIETFVLGANYMVRLMRFYRREVNNFSNDITNFENILENYYTAENDSYISDNGKMIQLFLQEQRCIYVQAERLVSDFLWKIPIRTYRNEDNKMYMPEINTIADELKHYFAETIKEFASKSQEIDASFIKRLIDNEKEAYCESDFENKKKKLKEKIDKLGEYGLSPKMELPKGYKKDFQTVLSLYIDDMEAKISVFDSLYYRLEVFDRMVSGKALSNKKMILNDGVGIKIVNDNKVEIPLTKLSNGEKNLLLLYYYLVFSLKKDALLLIDEPENSLHAAWLSKMLNDYIDMAEKLQCQIIIATHSTTFINGEWDITNDLYENNIENSTSCLEV